MLVALRAARPEPSPVKVFPALEKLLAPVEVRAVPKVLAPEKLLVAFFNATLPERRLSPRVPLLMVVAFSDVRPEPSPVKVFPALEKLLAPVKLLPTFSNATLPERRLSA